MYMKERESIFSHVQEEKRSNVLSGLGEIMSLAQHVTPKLIKSTTDHSLPFQALIIKQMPCPTSKIVKECYINFVGVFFFLAKDMLDLYSEKCVPHTYSTVTNFHLKCKHYRSWQELKHKHLFNKLFFSEARKALTVTLHQNIYIKQQNILSKGKM